ncbi:hypothetical protein [Taibaiella soli]|uniref:GAF domain-containing protein n=1 Tax=Taibaiella soli TaxID=1649169 RepID=A0A2W2BBX7_9BACT|nr:hypothetical protein [Taibaiella soli]PZF73719.1 hypothetical protein DN068_06905 [Taibaiella soli]
MEILTIDSTFQKGPIIRFNLSFEPYLRALEAYLDKCLIKEHRLFFESIRDAIKDHPGLKHPISDLKQLSEIKDVLDLLELNLFPLFPRDTEIEDAIGILSPIRFFSYSDGFKQILFNPDDTFRLEPFDIETTLEENYRMTYREILRKCYGLTELEPREALTIFQTRATGGIRAYYRMSINKQFVDIKVDGELPPLQQEWIDYATDILTVHRCLEHPIPLEQFRMEGFFIFTLKDVTEEEALHSLREIVANMHTQDEVYAFERMKHATLSYLGQEGLEVGMVPVVSLNRGYAYDDRIFQKTSLVFRGLQNGYTAAAREKLFNEFIASAGEKFQHSVYRNICADGETSDESEMLNRMGLQTLAVFPVWHQKKLMGLIEVGSQNMVVIKGNLVRKMEKVLPLFREFIVYQQNHFKELMESFIKERYTAIQPSVAWKFNDIAWHALQRNRHDFSDIATPTISFENLYPFYAAVDIRNSSQERSTAVRTDFLNQLHYLSHLLKNVNGNEIKDEIIELLLQIRYWQSQITDSLTIEQEADLTQFLETDSLQFIGRLKEGSYISEEEALDYAGRIATETGIFYRARNSYEESLQRINATLKIVLDEAEDRLQESIPHYLEKFKTDGWEYNLYSGKSIAPWQTYDTDAIFKIQNWQVRMMVDMAIAAHRIKGELPHQLSTTQLILAHMHPVNINFRIDEKRFDVEGAYSIRYEVIKKRIDKARILNSEERLTQPGTIAIVYAHNREAVAYRAQLQELIKEGRLLPDISFLELEKMQGITGMKAMRATINLNF